MASWTQVTTVSDDAHGSSSPAPATTTTPGGRLSLGSGSARKWSQSKEELIKLFNDQLLAGIKRGQARKETKSMRSGPSSGSGSGRTSGQAEQDHLPRTSNVESLIVCDPSDGDKALIWQPDDGCVYACRLALEGKQVTHIQVLVPSDPPMFDVENILLAGGCSSSSPSPSAGQDQCRHVILWGLRGIQILQLPHKWGSYNLYDGSKSNILCRSWPLAERLLACNKKLEILKCGWHQDVDNQSNAGSILMLTNDDVLRLFDLTHDPQTPVRQVNLSGAYNRLTSSHLDARISDRVWIVFTDTGETTSTSSTVGRNLNSSLMLTGSNDVGHGLGLGESAVSFDVGLPNEISASTLDLSRHRAVVVLPIYILYGNGDVIIVYFNTGRLKSRRSGSSNSDYSFACVGPLVMHPAAEDNYGMDACDLLVMGDIQPVIVISTSAGQLYHCIPLENPSDDKLPTRSRSGPGPNGLHFPVPTLFTYETMEMNFTPLSNSAVDVESMDNLTVRLLRDSTSHNRYLCVHPAGLHSVTVPFMDQFKTTGDVNLGNSGQKAVDYYHEEESVIEHMICTRPINTVVGQTDGQTGGQTGGQKLVGNNPLGVSVGFSRGRPFVLCLLSSGNLLVHPFPKRNSLSGSGSGYDSTSASSHFSSTPSNVMESIPARQITFEQAMREVLHKRSNVPLFKSSSSSSSSNQSPTSEIDRQSLELLLNTIDTVRREYLDRLELAAERMDRRAGALCHEKSLQIADLCQTLPDQLEEIWSRNETFNEKFIEILAKSDALAGELDDFVDELQLAQIELTDAERQMRSDLKRLRTKLDELADKFDLVRSKSAYQERIRSASRGQKESVFSPSLPLINNKASQQQQQQQQQQMVSANQMETLKGLLNEKTEQISDLVKQVTCLKVGLEIH